MYMYTDLHHSKSVDDAVVKHGIPGRSGALVPAPPLFKIYARLPLCKNCRMREGIDYVSLKRQFIAALFAYHTAKRVIEVADRRLAGLPFGCRFTPVYTARDGRMWDELSGEFGWINWHRYFIGVVKAAEYSMTKTCSCLGCQFETRMKLARLAVALGEAVKGRGERGVFEEGVEMLLDDAARVAELMIEAGETI